MKHIILRRVLFIALACLTTLAQAQSVTTTTKIVHLRAGPGRDYHVVTIVGPQTQLTLYGCLNDYSWCDVTTSYERGWIYARNLSYPY